MQISIQGRTFAAGYGRGSTRTANGSGGFSALLQAARSQTGTAGSRAAETGSQPAAYVVPMRTEKTLYYIGHGDGQYVSVEYAEGSTADDPVVRISGHSLSGDFDFTRHVRDLNPRNASYAELCALVGYQAQTDKSLSGGLPGPLQAVPLGMPVGDFLQKTDYQSAAARYLDSRAFSAGIYRQGMTLLRFYQSALLDMTAKI